MKQSEEGLMHGKVCMITGASRGIGFAAACELAEMGANVILVGHNQDRGDDARNKINQHTGREAARFFCADLSVMEEIERLSESVRSEYKRLDVLINNAGAFFLRRKESVDGIEMTFALNHLNYFKLTLLLLDLILDSAPARIINVSSESHQRAHMHFDDLQLENGYGGNKAYGQSKLANVLFTYELDRRLQDSRVTVNALHPGFISSHFGKQHWLMRPVMSVIHFLFGKSPEEGAQTPVYLAVSREGGEKSGLYYIDKKPAESAPASYDRQAAQKLWEISKEMSGLEDYDIDRVIQRKSALQQGHLK